MQAEISSFLSWTKQMTNPLAHRHLFLKRNPLLMGRFIGKCSHPWCSTSCPIPPYSMYGDLTIRFGRLCKAKVCLDQVTVMASGEAYVWQQGPRMPGSPKDMILLRSMYINPMKRRTL